MFYYISDYSLSKYIIIQKVYNNNTTRICQEPFSFNVCSTVVISLFRMLDLFLHQLNQLQVLWRRAYASNSRCPSDPHYLPTHRDCLMCCIETGFCTFHRCIITLNPKEKSTCKRSHLTTSSLQNEKWESTTIAGWTLNGRVGSASWGDIINPLPGHG